MSKKIYIDITDILKYRHYDNHPHIFTELISYIISSYKNITLLYFSDIYARYIEIPKKEYADIISGQCSDIINSEKARIIKIDDIEAYSVFMDMSNGTNAYPQRDWLFEQLININTEIVSVIADIQPVTQPHLYEDNDRMRFMYYIMAHLRYDETIITSPHVADEIKKLEDTLETRKKKILAVLPDTDLNTKTEDNVSQLESVFRKILDNLNTDNGIPFEHKPVKQMVFLSARPEPLLNTLPYIFHYMSFIKEIVVCCPDKMAEYLRQNYKGAASLTLITDTQLLEGHQLPEDHATRNFFLRCLAMQREELDDEFIMSDDDYRPLTEISEDVFFSDGKYNVYYFIDMANWRHTISDIFSYDRSHFKTLEFLKSNGYPSLQFSGHQPQIINKNWYRQLISEHSEIITRGYDEWSTYFDFCAVHHRKYFRQLPYITLGWPNVGTIWKHGVKIQNYYFENFYEDNYTGNGIFGKLSPGLCETTDEENKIKIQTAQKVFSDCTSGFEVYDSFCNSYISEHHQLPSFSIHCPSGDPDNIICISAPQVYQMKTGVLNELRFRISRADISICNSNNILISITVSDEQGNEYFSVEKKVTPEQTETNCHIDLYETDKQLILNICCHIEKRTEKAYISLPLILL